ncbi:MAG TPA: ABC transporter permease [Reyranella sp.]|nr:ABC transporter permease [Reyranella sp.]
MTDIADIAPLAPATPARGGRRLRLTRAGWVGVAIIAFWTSMALLAPVLPLPAPNASDLAALANPLPSAAHWLGVDLSGRDILSRIIWGSRTVLTVAPIAVAGATVMGALLGLLAGYYRGAFDSVLSRISDVILSFPVIILYMIILTRFGASALNIVLVITVTKAPIIYRLVRAMTLELAGREYVAAAQMRGEGAAYIMLVEILPNARGPILVDVCLRLGYTTIAIGVLGFLGIGLPPPTPDWGGMVRETYGMISLYPHMAIIPCVAISTLVIGFNLLAVGLRRRTRRG